MPTLKQIEANKQNSKNSTGPKTEAGKEKASQNAIKHGLTSTRTLVGAEDALEYHQLRAAFFKDYAPINTQEEFLVDRIASAAWRTLRTRQMEQSLANMSIEKMQRKRERKHKRPPTRNPKTDTEALVLSMVQEDLWRLMHRYDTQISRDYFKSVETLRMLQNDRIRDRHLTIREDRQARHEDREDQKLAMRKERDQRQQSQQTQPTVQPNQANPDENWLPFERARPAGASANAPNRAEPDPTPRPPQGVAA